MILNLWRNAFLTTTTVWKILKHMKNLWPDGPSKAIVSWSGSRPPSSWVTWLSHTNFSKSKHSRKLSSKNKEKTSSLSWETSLATTRTSSRSRKSTNSFKNLMTHTFGACTKNLKTSVSCFRNPFPKISFLSGKNSKRNSFLRKCPKNTQGVTFNISSSPLATLKLLALILSSTSPMNSHSSENSKLRSMKKKKKWSNTLWELKA